VHKLYRRTKIRKEGIISARERERERERESEREKVRERE
jgi:hypothetical protein